MVMGGRERGSRGQIRSQRFLGKLLSANAKKMQAYSWFGRLSFIVKKYKILATTMEKIPEMSFVSAFETFFEALLLSILTQNKVSASQNSL